MSDLTRGRQPTDTRNWRRRQNRLWNRLRQAEAQDFTPSEPEVHDTAPPRQPSHAIIGATRWKASKHKPGVSYRLGWRLRWRPCPHCGLSRYFSLCLVLEVAGGGRGPGRWVRSTTIPQAKWPKKIRRPNPLKYGHRQCECVRRRGGLIRLTSTTLLGSSMRNSGQKLAMRSEPELAVTRDGDSLKPIFESWR